MIVRELVARFGFQTDTSGLDKADKRITTTKDRVDGLGKALGGAFAALGAYGVAGKVTEAVDASNRFGEAMGKIQSLIPGNISRAREYKTAILDLSTAYGTSADDLAATMYDLVSTFGDAADNVEKLQLVTKMAVAGNTSARESMGLLTAITKSYGDESLETMKKVADLAAQTINYGVIEMPALTAGMRDSANMAATLGVNMEELFGVFASASAITGLGPEVGTQLQSVFRAMLDKSKPMAAAFKKAGFKGAADAIQKSGGLGPALVKLAEQTDGTEEGLNALFGRVEGMKLSMFLTGKGADNFKDKIKLMGQAAGATTQMFKGTTEGLAANAFQAKKTTEKLQALKVKVGDELAKPLNDAKTAAGEFATVLGDDLLPLIETWNDEPMQTQSLDDIRESAHAAAFWFTGLAEAIDTTLSGLSALGNLAKLGGQEIWQLAGLSPSGMARVWREREAETEAIFAGWKQRSFKRGAMLDNPDWAKAQGSLERTRVEVEEERSQTRQKNRDFLRTIATTGFRSAVAAGDVKVSGNSFNFSLPPGTPVQQAEMLGGQVANVLARELNRARRAVPKRTDKSGVEGFGGAGTNSTMQDAWATGTGL